MKQKKKDDDILMPIFLEPAMSDILKCKVTHFKLNSSDILRDLYILCL